MKKELDANKFGIKKRLEDAYLHLLSARIVEKRGDLAKQMGVDNGNLSKAFNGDKRYLTNPFLEKFANQYAFNIEWLLTGEGEMLKSDNSSNTKPKVSTKDIVSYNQGEGKPYYDIDFINGFSGAIDLTTENPEYNIIYPPADNCDFWVNATGYSMQGHINHGDTVALKKVDSEWFPLGEIYAIVTTNNHRMIKRISKSDNPKCYKLISSNPDKEKYPDQDIPKEFILHLFKVVCSIKIVN